MNGPAPRQLDMMRSAIARRAALAREPHPEGVRKPPLRLFFAELASLRRGGRKLLGIEKALHPQPVMLLPGFGAQRW